MLLVPGATHGAEPEAAGVETAPVPSAPSPIAERDLPDDPEALYSSPEDRTELRVTVYQSGGAALTETREIGLRDGENRLALGGLPETLRPETVTLASEHVPDVIDTRFTTGELSGERLLDAFLGRDIHVQGPADPGLREGRLVAVRGDEVIVSFDEGIERIPRASETRFRFPEVPPGLRGTPTLEARLTSERGGTEPVQLNYHAGGLSWSPFYRLTVHDGQPAELVVVARLEQESGVELPRAHVRFVAASLEHRPPAREEAVARLARAEDRDPDRGAPPLDGFPTFELPQPLDLRPASIHQARLFRDGRVEVERGYRTRGRADARPRQHGQHATMRQAVHREARWEASRDLPAGQAQVHRRATPGAAPEPVGVGTVPATPAGEEVRLDIGPAFDFSAHRTLEHWERLGDDGYVAEWRIELRNSGPETRTVTVDERMPEGWELEEASHDHRQPDAFTAQWDVTVPPRGVNSLTYRVRVEDDR